MPKGSAPPAVTKRSPRQSPESPDRRRQRRSLAPIGNMMTEATQAVIAETAPAAQEVAAPVRGTPEWDAAMIKVAEDNNVQTRVIDANGQIVEDKPTSEAPKPVERPAHIPEKFWKADDKDPLLSATERMA